MALPVAHVEGEQLESAHVEGQSLEPRPHCTGRAGGTKFGLSYEKAPFGLAIDEVSGSQHYMNDQERMNAFLRCVSNDCFTFRGCRRVRNMCCFL